MRAFAPSARTCAASHVVAELGEQRVRLLRQRGRLARLLGLDAPGELLRTVVGVDELVVVPAEPQGELEVALDGAHRSNSAAWPWPTPTQSVARP